VRASKLAEYETWVLETVCTRGRDGGPLRGEPTSVAEPRQVYAFRNVILNPVAIPPFFRVDLHAIELHGEMDMVASGHSRLPTGAHDLASLHHVAFMHINLAKVAVDRL